MYRIPVSSAPWCISCRCLPYQRIRSRLTVIATHRGEFTFGPAKLSSGDPVGLRERSALTEGLEHLLVYPKVFALSPAGIVSRALLGDLRSRRELLHDPSRTAGVREYRVGDPLRFVDWRATARSTSLMVREFEPSVTPRVAVFLDFSDPTIGSCQRRLTGAGVRHLGGRVAARRPRIEKGRRRPLLLRHDRRGPCRSPREHVARSTPGDARGPGAGETLGRRSIRRRS